MKPTESYKKVHYELRPAKQVERRMIIDGLQSLSVSGFNITQYHYIGMGSLYFVDFILFHKLLGINKMTSVEYSESIQRRVKFNKPYGFIKMELKPIGDVISNLSPDLHHLLWLDYDDVFHREHIDDIVLAASLLSRGSILLVTLDAEPPIDSNEPADWHDYYLEEVGEYLPPNSKNFYFRKSNLPIVNIRVIKKAISAGLASRDVDFIPLFSFGYKDGHEMISYGGIIGDESERAKIHASALLQKKYIRLGDNDQPFYIQVPRVTRKERLYLDSAMPCKDSWKPKDFEFSKDELLAYREVYQFLPAYAELLL